MDFPECLLLSDGRRPLKLYAIGGAFRSFLFLCNSPLNAPELPVSRRVKAKRYNFMFRERERERERKRQKG